MEADEITSTNDFNGSLSSIRFSSLSLRSLTHCGPAKSICIDLLLSPLSSFLLVVIIMKWIWSKCTWPTVSCLFSLWLLTVIFFKLYLLPLLLSSGHVSYIWINVYNVLWFQHLKELFGQFINSLRETLSIMQVFPGGEKKKKNPWSNASPVRLG